MTPDIRPSRSNLPELDIKPAESLNAIRKADVIRMSRVEAILQEELSQEGMPDAVESKTWDSEESDLENIIWTKEEGFLYMGRPTTHLIISHHMKACGYMRSVEGFFSFFPISPDVPELHKVRERIREAVIPDPTDEELQRLPEILAANYKRVSEGYLFQAKECLAKNNINQAPWLLRSAKEHAQEAGVSIDPQLEQDILQEYHLKRISINLAELPYIRANIMGKIGFVDEIIESDEFLGKEHPEVVKKYAARAALQALRVVRDYIPFGIDKNKKAQDMASKFNYWEQRALKWADIGGIDITQELKELRAYIDLKIQEILKPASRKFLDNLQRRIRGEAAIPGALSKPDLGPEDTEIERAYHDDISILIKTKKGRIIVARLSSYTANDFAIMFPPNSFTKEKILAVLAKTFPEAEVYHSTPDFLFTQEEIMNVRIAASDTNEEFAGIRVPLNEERDVRALWLTIRNAASRNYESHPYEFDTLASPGGQIENFHFPFDSLIIRIEGEINEKYISIFGKDKLILSPYILTDSEVVELHQKLGAILERLINNDSIASISTRIEPDLRSPMRLGEFTKKKEFHLEKEELKITVKGSGRLETEKRKIADPLLVGKFVFQERENQFVIINEFIQGLTYTSIKFYPGGLQFSELAQEVERLKVA